MIRPPIDPAKERLAAQIRPDWGRPDWERILDEVAREREIADRLRVRAGGRTLQRRQSLFQRIADRLKVGRRNTVQGAAAKVVDQSQSIRIAVRHGSERGVQKKLCRQQPTAEIQLTLGQGSDSRVLTVKAPLQIGDDLVLTLDPVFHGLGEAPQGGGLSARRKAEAESGPGETCGGDRRRASGGAA